MSRYVQLLIGVHDNDLNVDVLPNTPAWDDYIAWCQQGNTPDPYVPPIDPPLSQEEIDARAARAARQAIFDALKADPLIRALRTRTPAQVDTWIDTNVTDLASARGVLKTLARVIAYFALERF